MHPGDWIESTRADSFNAMATPFAHCYVDLEHPLSPVAVVATARARRLVVFVHGWGGSAYSSWGEFDAPPRDDPWWAEADLLFVDYPSRKETVLAAADRVRTMLRDFYPSPYQPMLVIDGVAVREDVSAPYDELLLVGHSMGGLVLRRALLDEMDEWSYFGEPADSRPPLLDGQLRLFSPASAGFLPRGRLALAFAAWPILDRALRVGLSYPDLAPDSVLIRDTRRRTERYDTRTGDGRALAARILWANPEDIVLTEKYDTDSISRTVDPPSYLLAKLLHEDVCRPMVGYDLPYRFVSTGDTT